MDRYVFNGVVYNTNGQVLPSTYSQADANYWIDMPTNGQAHVSISIYYHDLDDRKWKTDVTVDLTDGSWKANSLPRKRE